MMTFAVTDIIRKKKEGGLSQKIDTQNLWERADSLPYPPIFICPPFWEE